MEYKRARRPMTRNETAEAEAHQAGSQGLDSCTSTCTIASPCHGYLPCMMAKEPKGGPTAE